MKASIIRALALEVGDICMDVAEMQDESPREPASVEKERKMAVEIRQVFEGAEYGDGDGGLDHGDSADDYVEEGDSKGKSREEWN